MAGKVRARIFRQKDRSHYFSHTFSFHPDLHPRVLNSLTQFRLRNDLRCVGWGVKVYSTSQTWPSFQIFQLFPRKKGNRDISEPTVPGVRVDAGEWGTGPGPVIPTERDRGRSPVLDLSCNFDISLKWLETDNTRSFNS